MINYICKFFSILIIISCIVSCVKSYDHIELLEKFYNTEIQIKENDFAVVAVTAIGIGSYKAYDSYVASNMSTEDLLFAENVEALSMSDNDASKKMKTLPVVRKKQPFLELYVLFHAIMN